MVHKVQQNHEHAVIRYPYACSDIKESSSCLALKMTCEPAMVVAADLSRSWVMFDFDTQGIDGCSSRGQPMPYIYQW